MRYIVDGYNLMFRVLHAGEDLQQQREAIIRTLNDKAKLLNLNLSIVFDGHYAEGESTRTHYNIIEIHYSAEGQSADDYIFTLIKHSPRPQQITLISSDKKLAWRVRRLGAKTETVESFIKQITQRTKQRRQISKQTPKKPISQPPPLQKQSEDALFDYYLQAFEEKDQKPVTSKRKKAVSDKDRWLKIFEKKTEEEGNGA
ncbi:MAG: NYN domain-containing protein [Chlamydiales bacterium]|nr:NYN domain-containing protein [Chlamydiia bacterium]MCP5507380.1 NYN domain-containing protein [Chlamydiales bacterium]